MCKDSKSNRKIIRLTHECSAPFDNFECTDVKCNNPKHFTDYLHYMALSDSSIGMGQTYVMCEYKNDIPTAVLGYVTLKATSFITSYSGETMSGDPAIEITELAVDKRYTGQGVGSALLKYAIGKAYYLKEKHIGVKKVVLCATKEAAPYYSREPFKFRAMGDSYEIPREGWNESCVGMYITIQ